MYTTFRKSPIKRICDTQGKSLEEEIAESLASKRPLEISSELIFTEKKDGVLPQYNVRTDKQELAIDLATKFEKSDAMRGQLAENAEDEQEQEQTQEQGQQTNVE